MGLGVPDPATRQLLGGEKVKSSGSLVILMLIPLTGFPQQSPISSCGDVEVPKVAYQGSANDLHRKAEGHPSLALG
jgi:hypothetical protein